MIAQAAKKGVEVAFTDLERLVDIPALRLWRGPLHALQFLRTQARQQLVYRLAKALRPGRGLLPDRDRFSRTCNSGGWFAHPVNGASRL